MRCARVAGDAQVVVDAKEGNKVVVGWELEGRRMRLSADRRGNGCLEMRVSSEKMK
jgi:hypothetical protein